MVLVGEFLLQGVVLKVGGVWIEVRGVAAQQIQVARLVWVWIGAMP